MRYASFIVRIWVSDEHLTSGELALRGQIEHVQSKVVTHLTCLEDVTAFIRKEVTPNEKTYDSDGCPDPVRVSDEANRGV